MRILNVIQCTNLGGMEHTNLLRMKYLISQGHKVDLISLNPLGAQAPTLKEVGIKSIGLEHNPIKTLFKVGHVARKWSGQAGYDSVLQVGHNLWATLAIAGMPAGRKVLSVHYHHDSGWIAAQKWRSYYDLCVHVMDHIVFCSEFIHRQALAICPRLAGRSSVVRGPFPVPSVVADDIRRHNREKLGIPDDAFVVGNAGWLIDRKRFDVFVDVAALINAKLSNAWFVVAGDGPNHDDLLAQAARLGLEGRLRFLGWQKSLDEFYSTLDVLLFSTDNDALSRTPVEAAAFGVPVVASVISGGFEEVIENGRGAYIFPVHDRVGLAETVLMLAADQDLRKVQGALARSSIEKIQSSNMSDLERILVGSFE